MMDGGNGASLAATKNDVRDMDGEVVGLFSKRVVVE